MIYYGVHELRFSGFCFRSSFGFVDRLSLKLIEGFLGLAGLLADTQSTLLTALLDRLIISNPESSKIES